MAFYGNDFLTATLLNNYQYITDGEIVVGSNDHDFFRFVVSNATNRIIVSGNQGNHNTTFRLYDSTETEIDSHTNNDDSYFYNLPFDLAPGTYYLEYNPDNTFSEPYTLQFILNENDTFPPLTQPMIEPLYRGESDLTWLHDTIFDSNVVTIHYAPSLPPYNNVVTSQFPSLIDLGYTIPDAFYDTKIIMVGKRLGTSVPLKRKSDISPRYVIKGKVQENGVDLPNKTVRLYDRDGGELIGETITDALGNYRFPNPLWQDSKYYVIAFDDLSNPILQAVIHDALIPFEET